MTSFDQEALSHMAATSDRATRRNLITSLRRMADSLEEPVDTIHKYGHIDLEKASIQIGFDLGLFKVLAGAKGSMTAEELAKETGADPNLMKRILRYYNTTNVVREVGPHVYEATNITRNLTDECCTAALSHYYGFVAKQYQATPSYLKSIHYQDPQDPSNTAIQAGWETDKQAFELMLSVPGAMDHFHKYMSLRRQTDLSWLSVYPVLSEIGNVSSSFPSSSRPLYVNVGGGIGHQCAQFLSAYPDLPGRVILQDLPDTIARALPTPRVENVAHNFFEPQPDSCKGAKFYFMRGVPHNHPKEKAALILRNVREVMAKDSVLLVDESVLPEERVGRIAASIDLTMMGAFAAGERTEGEWREVAEMAGLRLGRVWVYNGLENECVMEMRLPEGAVEE